MAATDGSSGKDMHQAWASGQTVGWSGCSQPPSYSCCQAKGTARGGGASPETGVPVLNSGLPEVMGKPLRSLS